MIFAMVNRAAKHTPSVINAILAYKFRAFPNPFPPCSRWSFLQESVVLCVYIDIYIYFFYGYHITCFNVRQSWSLKKKDRVLLIWSINPSRHRIYYVGVFFSWRSLYCKRLVYISDAGYVGPMKRRTTNTYIVEYNISYKYIVYNILYIIYNIYDINEWYRSYYL